MMSEFYTSLRYGFKLPVAMFLLHEIRGQSATRSSVNDPIITLRKIFWKLMLFLLLGMWIIPRGPMGCVETHAHSVH